MAHYYEAGGAGASSEDSASRMMEEESAEAPAENGWVVDSVSIRRAKNGGWIVSCSKHQPNLGIRNLGPGSYESNDYTFDSLAEAVPFIESEFGGGASAEGGGAGVLPAVPPPAGGMA